MSSLRRIVEVGRVGGKLLLKRGAEEGVGGHGGCVGGMGNRGGGRVDRRYRGTAAEGGVVEEVGAGVELCLRVGYRLG